MIHYIWLVKADLKKPLEYAFLLGVLVAYRLIVWIADRNRADTKVDVTENISSSA